MKKFLFLFFIWIYPVFSCGAINEYLTDVYYANGMQVDEGNATASTDLLMLSIFKERYGGNEIKMKKHIGKVTESYNSTHGFAFDLLESAMQKFSLQLLIDWYARLKGYITSHVEDIRLQINAYKSSIKDGHKVLVVAHSQGNLFTGEAYIALGKESKNGWMQEYFEAVSVASPRTENIKDGTERIDWDNDPVSRAATWGEKSSLVTEDPTRKVSWESEPYIGEAVIMPSVNYVDISQLNKVYKERYKAVEDGLDFSFNVHAFAYYMGECLGGCKNPILNPFDDKPMKTNDAKTKIMFAIKTQLDKLEKVESQWKPKNLGCFCKDKYAEMTHEHDPENMKFPEPNKVKDFAEKEAGKIYRADAGDHMEYVRAACGGEIIKEVDEGEVCYRLEDKNATKEFGEIKGDQEQNSSIPGGLFTASLDWEETTVSMEMSNSLMPVSVSGCGFAKLSSDDLTLHDVYPGTYPINVSAENYEEVDDENLSDTVTLEVSAVTAYSKGDFVVTNKYQYPNLGNGGHIADIVITRPKPGEPLEIESIPVNPPHGGNYGSSGYGGNSVPHIYEPTPFYTPYTPPPLRLNPMCESTSCACMPCEYHILLYWLCLHQR